MSEVQRIVDEGLPDAKDAWSPAVGDVVRLRSGGPPMTVTSLTGVDPGTVGVAWFDAMLHAHGDEFPTACLLPEPREEPPPPAPPADHRLTMSKGPGPGFTLKCSCGWGGKEWTRAEADRAWREHVGPEKEGADVAQG